MKELFVDQRKRISLYDDLFSLKDRTNIYEFAAKSYFKLGWNDSHFAEKSLYSEYSQEDVQTLGIVDLINSSPAKTELNGFCLVGTILNLSTPSDSNFIHSHKEDKIILYYVNLEWNSNWHGETLFFNESCKDIMFASPYTPGRIIAFDASIPHTIRPQSYVAQHYRFTLTLLLKKGN